MRKYAFAVVALTLLAGSAASGQAPSPVVLHFRQYREAIARGDLVAAEGAAAFALEASEQSDAAGGRTGVLALNLARVRLQLGRTQAASAPAQRAYEIARSDASAGIDPDMASLIWGRVRLSLEGFAAADFLADTLGRTAGREPLLGDRYDAADQLGMWATGARNYIVARRAWAYAAESARGAPFDASYARGRALTYEAIAIALQSLTREPVMSNMMARNVQERLIEAHALVRPFAFMPSDGTVTAVHRLYADILGWEQITNSKVVSDGSRRVSGDRSIPALPFGANPASIDGVPTCVVRRVAGERLRYPRPQATEGQIAAVVVALRFDEAGAQIGTEIASAIGDQDFERAVSETAATWTYAAQVANGCKLLRVYFVPVGFFVFEE
ncbi:MAG: hypothetical protein JNJ73_20835 [Hyphomonadaceae bacterium]|nr:hypothetical protein [Hyphomonadaceae bacterium]